MTSTETSLGLNPSAAWPGLWKIARRVISTRLKSLTAGSLTISFPHGGVIRHHGSQRGPNADLFLHRWRGLWRLLREGDLGLARAYMDGDCSSSDLKALIAFGAANCDELAGAVSSSRFAVLCDRWRHRKRSNTRRGSRRNIAAHYDLGNALYAQWLDNGMNYSAALYTERDQSLEAAQTNKLERIAEMLDIQQGQRILEIGCGWGALAEHLARDHSCVTTGLTLSAEQLDYARRRPALAQAADFRLQDYRDSQGRYERIVSIEMLEAVGERFWPVYFRKLRDSLTDNGVAVLQVITIAANRFDQYRRHPDFIQRFIFPGGMLPTTEIIEREARRAGFAIQEHQRFGGSYARTLAEWRKRFLHAWPQIELLGFDARFKRMWEYYLAYCEVGFETGVTDVSLIKLTPV